MKTHREIREIVAGKKKGISNKRFFESRSFAFHLADIARAQTGRYGIHRKVHAKVFWKPKDDFAACTNGNLITINAGNSLVTNQKGLENRYYMVLGLFAHELGHLLYTDFLSLQTYGLRLNSGVWFPDKPRLDTATDVRHEAEIFTFYEKEEKNKKIFLKLAQTFHNVIEDGYIEGVLLNRYPGKLGHALAFLRHEHFIEMPTLTEMIEQEDDSSHICQTLLGLVLSYAKFGRLKYGSEPFSDERIQVVFSLLDDIDTAVGSGNPLERLEVTNIILVRLWPYIRDFIEQCEDIPDIEDFVGKALGAIPGATAVGDGDTVPVSSPTGSPGTMPSAASRAETSALAGGGSDGEDEIQDVNREEGGRMESEDTHATDAPMGGTTEWDTDYKGTSYPNAAADIDRILDNEAERLAMSDLEKHRTAELNAEAQEIEYGDIHSGVNKVIHRISDIPDSLVEAYEMAAPKLLQISKQLQKAVKDKLQDKRKGGKQTGLYLGRKLDVHALPRRDGRVFYKNSLPNETPELAVGLLLDESGSMSWGDRATYARTTAVILHDFCVAMKIPVMVYGHSTGSDSVALYSYAEFESYDNRDKYRLMDISSRSENRDGAALRYVMERLKKRPEEVKLLILVSDGQPSDGSYYGSGAEADLRGIKAECDKAHIMLVAAGIGDDKPVLERIYGNSFMDITDLNLLPIQLAEKIKKYIRT